jgi:hypothetical protein
LMVFGKRCLGRIFACKRGKETGEWRKLHIDLHSLYFAPNIMMIKSTLTYYLLITVTAMLICKLAFVVVTIVIIVVVTMLLIFNSTLMRLRLLLFSWFRYFLDFYLLYTLSYHLTSTRIFEIFKLKYCHIHNYLCQIWGATTDQRPIHEVDAK